MEKDAENGEVSNAEKEERELQKLDAKMWCQQDFAQALRYATYTGGLSIREIAEELRSFYDEDEREYLKTLI